MIHKDSPMFCVHMRYNLAVYALTMSRAYLALSESGSDSSLRHVKASSHVK